MNRLCSATRIVAIPLAAILLGGGAAPAGAASEIEGIWSFNGGQVAIHAIPSGKFEGTVVTPTTFAECPHQAGEEIWTNMTLQADGSFWGFHQWLFEKSCVPNPVLGPTAWRVLQKANGSRYLLVCFSEPGGPQPTIASNGASANVKRPCQESAPTAPLPVVTGSGKKGKGMGAEQISFASTIGLPKAAACVRRGSLKIKIKDPRFDPLKEVVIRIGRRKVADVRGVQRLRRGIVLKRLPSGTYTLKVVAITVLDQKLSGRRTYHSCTIRRSSSRIRLHHRKSGHR
jgi:hypothetical protein